MFENFSDTQDVIPEKISEKSNSHNFVEFGSFTQFTGARKRPSGDVFKSQKISNTNNKTIQISSGDEDQPIIVVRRSQNAVDSIEFSCKCGRSSIVQLKYD